MQHDENRVWGLIKLRMATAIQFVKPYWYVYVALSALLPSSLILGMLVLYSISADLPPLDVVEYLGANVIYIAIFAVILFCATLVYAMLPGIVSAGDPLNGEASPSREINYLRWADRYGIAIVAYIVFASWVLSETSVGHDYWKLTSSLAIIPITLMLISYRRAKKSGGKYHLGFIVTSNIASAFILTAFYAFAFIRVASNTKSDVNRLYILISNSISEAAANGAAAALIYLFPIGLLIIFTLRANSTRNVAWISVIVSFLTITVWPGGLTFVRSAFYAFKIGGNVEAVMWLKADAACRHPTILKSPEHCSDEKLKHESSGETIPLNLGLITDRTAYVRVNYEGKSGKLQGKKFESILLLPRADIAALVFLGNEVAADAP